MQVAAKTMVSPQVTSTLPWAWRAMCPVSRISFLPASSHSTRALLWFVIVSLFFSYFSSDSFLNDRVRRPHPTVPLRTGQRPERVRSTGARACREPHGRVPRAPARVAAWQEQNCGTRKNLASQAQATDHGLVALGVPLSEVAQELAALSHHHQQTSSRGLILAVGLQVLGQVLDV